MPIFLSLLICRDEDGLKHLPACVSSEASGRLPAPSQGSLIFLEPAPTLALLPRCTCVPVVVPFIEVEPNALSQKKEHKSKRE